MYFGEDDGPQSLVLAIVFGLVGLVVAGAIALAISAGSVRDVAEPALVLAQPTLVVPPTPALSAQDAALAASDEASVKVEYGVAKFYFASGSADLAAGAGEALAGLIGRLTPGRRLVISGFHDASGGALKNAELAKQRATAVRNALQKAGVKTAQMRVEKPQQMTADDSSAEARRVEVTLQ